MLFGEDELVPWNRDCKKCIEDFQALNPDWVKPADGIVFDFQYHDRDCAECSDAHSCYAHKQYCDNGMVICAYCGGEIIEFIE